MLMESARAESTRKQPTYKASDDSLDYHASFAGIWPLPAPEPMGDDTPDFDDLFTGRDLIRMFERN